MVRDFDFASPQRSDVRRLEVVAEGLTLFRGCQLAIDATVVSPRHSDGTHRRRADATDGQVLGEARKLKERTHPELCQAGRACAIGGGHRRGRGRWSQETKAVVVVLGMREGRFTSAKVVWQHNEQRGSDVGAVFWRVPQLRQSLDPCWE